ncbi:MAG TPA: hypothetical protein VJ397_07460 [Thermoplasmata archaeon]|nr:hypothetical protein [Thermoplasmata archaeon]
MPPMAYAAPMRPQTGKPIAGGALLLIAGILGLLNIVITFAIAGSMLAFMAVIPGAAAIIAVCLGIIALFSIFALVGGIVALRRRMWGLALVGGILGLFSIGPLFISSILSLVGLILIAISKEEFA